MVALLLVAACGNGKTDEPPPPLGGPVEAAAPGPDAPSTTVDAAAVDATTDLAVPTPDVLPADAAGVDASVAADAPAIDAGSDGGAADGLAPRLVTVHFTGAVATVTGQPLGLGDPARAAPVSGSFTYDLQTRDQLPADPRRGRFEHGTTSAFTFTVLGHTVSGSGWAIVQTEDLDPDTFRYLDGPQGDGVPRVMKLDGAPAPTLKLGIAITDSTGALLKSDALPDPFPAVDIAHLPHTFSLEDQGGTLLMQLDTLTSP
jgi:hypothetical protein